MAGGDGADLIPLSPAAHGRVYIDDGDAESGAHGGVGKGREEGEWRRGVSDRRSCSVATTVIELHARTEGVDRKY